jgi:hypothetical protein
VGVLDGVELFTSETGTAQGSVLSPLLGNVYLHYALDRWFERRVKPRLRGQATLVRHADDFVIGFEYRDDAQRVMDALGPRLGHFGLTLHPDKTRLVGFRRPPKGSRSGKGRATFDFLGFTCYWARTRKGRWGMFCKPAPVQAIAELVQVAGHVFLAHPTEGSEDPGLEVREDRVAPGQDLGRASAIGPLNVPIWVTPTSSRGRWPENPLDRQGPSYRLSARDLTGHRASPRPDHKGPRCGGGGAGYDAGSLRLVAPGALVSLRSQRSGRLAPGQ